MLTKSHILYEGEWKNGNPCGFGIVCYPNPNKKTFHLGYKGRFVEGKLNRTGTYHHSDGSYYIGKWKEGKRQGYGIMWYQDGSFYAGDFFNNFRHGLGTYVRPDGKRYDGEWKKGLKHGKGKLLHLNKGQMQLGVWVDDICVFSVIEDIPYRPVAEFFTPYPIQRVSKRSNTLLYIADYFVGCSE